MQFWSDKLNFSLCTPAVMGGGGRWNSIIKKPLTSVMNAGNSSVLRLQSFIVGKIRLGAIESEVGWGPEPV